MPSSQYFWILSPNIVNNWLIWLLYVGYHVIVFKEVTFHFHYLNMADDGGLNVRTSQGNIFYGTFFPQSCQTSEGQRTETFGLDVIKNNFRAIGRKIVSFYNSSPHIFLGHRPFSWKIPFVPSYIPVHRNITRKNGNMAFIFNRMLNQREGRIRNSTGVRTPELQAQIYFCLWDDL